MSSAADRMTIGKGWRLPFLLPLFASFLVGIAACREPAAPPERPVAVVNGEAIGRKEFQERFAAEASPLLAGMSLQEGQLEVLKEEVLARLIEERLIIQQAKALGIAVADAELTARIAEIRQQYGGNGDFQSLFGRSGLDYVAWREALRKRLLMEKVIEREVNGRVAVSEEEARRYYQANRGRYQGQRRVRAAQIVVRDQDKAEAILKRLKDGEDFAKVAREESIAPEAAGGGDLGYFERGVMPVEIDRVVFSLPPGRISAVVKSPYGFHIFKVLDRQEGGGKFQDVKDRVTSDLRRLKEAEAYEVWLKELQAKAAVRIERPLPEVPLPAGQEKEPQG